MKLRHTVAALSILMLTSLGFSISPHALAINTTGAVYNVNLITGAGVSVGASGLSNAKCMTRVNDIWYAIDGSARLYEIDPGTGSANLIYTLNLGGLTDVRGMAVDANNKYYLAVDGGANNDQLWTFNNVTGVGTFVSTMGRTSIQGIAMSFNGLLYAYSVESNNAGGLLLVDPTTGVTTDLDGGAPGTQDIQDICPSGNLFYGANNNIYKIAQTNGFETLTGSGAYSNLRGLARREHPAQLTGMTVKLGALKSGTLTDIMRRDGQTAVFAKAFVPNLTVDPVNVELTYNIGIPSADAEEVGFAMYGRMLTSGSFQLSIDAKNVLTNQFESLSTPVISTTRNLYVGDIFSNTPNYVSASKIVTFRFRVKATGFVASPAWSVELDMARAEVFGNFQ